MSGDETLPVAAIQLNSQDNVERNLDECRRLVGAAATAGAKLVLLPENFAFMGTEEERCRHAEVVGDLDAPIQHCLRELAQRHGVTLIGGGFPEQSGDVARPYNAAIAVSPAGDVVAHYRKIHLFDVDLADGTQLRESACTSQGSEPVVFDHAGFKLGLSICYDLRFPELYRGLARHGIEIMLVPAAFTLHTGKDHWHVLLRARAIENQCWVLAAGQWGKHPRGRTTYGHSLLVDPWGTVVAECSDDVGYLLSEVNPALTRRVRDSLPSLRHRCL